MHIFVIGGSGFLGQRLIERARQAGHRVTATFHANAPAAADGEWCAADIRNRDGITALARSVRPDVIINAAYRQSDWEVTADGGMNVALAASVAGARLVHVSSDVVFSGAAPRYAEDCHPDPVSSYGAAKAAAETAVRGVAPDAVIARTSLIIGNGDSKHEQLVHALAAGAPGRLYTDAIRCPVHADDLAAALVELSGSHLAGVCHLAGPDAVSRYELGLLIAARDGLEPAALPGGPCPATAAPGPLDVRLDSRRTQAVLSTRLRGAREFLATPAPP